MIDTASRPDHRPTQTWLIVSVNTVSGSCRMHNTKKMPYLKLSSMRVVGTSDVCARSRLNWRRLSASSGVRTSSLMRQLGYRLIDAEYNQWVGTLDVPKPKNPEGTRAGGCGTVGPAVRRRVPSS